MARWDLGDIVATPAEEQLMRAWASAPSGSPQYEAMLTRMMETGYTRGELHGQIGEAYAGGQLPSRSVTAAEEWLRETHLPGHEEYKKAWRGGTQEERKEGYVSPAAWAQQYPEHLRLRRQHSIPISQLPKDPYDRPQIPEGYTRRKGEAHAFSTEVLTQGSWWGQTPSGETVTTSPVEKAMKRIQTLGAHEMVQMTGLGKSPEFLPAGPMAGRAEPAQQVRAAYVLGGDIFGPGTMGVSPSMGRATQRVYKEMVPPEGRESPWTAITGATFPAGGQMQLAGGMPSQETGKWSYTIKDVAALTGGGYGYALERSASLEQSRIFGKMGATKLQASMQGAAIAGATTAAGDPLNVQLMGGLKDVQGYVYEHFRGGGTQYLQETIAAHRGVEPSEVQLPQSWSQISQEAMQAFTSQRLEGALQTIHVPQQMTAENLAAFGRSGALVRGSARHQGEGVYSAQIAYQALVGTVGKQLGHMYPGKQANLSYEQLQTMRQANPQLYQETMNDPEGRMARWAHQSVLEATKATAEGTTPRGTMGAEQLPLKGLFAGAHEMAQAVTPEGAEVSGRQVTTQFMNLLAATNEAGQHISVDLPGGKSIVAPPPAAMQRFRAPGPFGEEQSAYQTAYANLMAAQVGGVPEELTAAAAKFQAEQLKVAGGKDFFRKAFGAPIPRGTSQMDVLHTSLALKEREVAAPGVPGGRTVQTTGYPERAEMMQPRMQATTLTAAQKQARGISAGELTLSMEMTQAHARDADGDLIRAINTGEVITGAGGKITDKHGVPLDTADDILGAAKRAMEEGAGNVREEMAGLTGQALSREEAVDAFRGQVDNATTSTQEQIQEQIQEGAEKYERIGQYHVALGRGGRAGIPEHSEEAMERLFQGVHGYAQRPALLPEQRSRFMALSKMNLWGVKGGRPTTHAYSLQEGGPVRVGTRGRFSGLMGAAASSLVGMETKEGDPFLSAEQIASVMGTADPEQRAGIEAAVKGYRAAPGGTSKAAQLARGLAMSKVVQALPGDVEWATKTGAGMMLGPAALSRALKTEGVMPGKLGFSEEEAAKIMSVRPLQEATVAAASRKSLGGDETAFLAKLQAQQDVMAAAGQDVPMGGAAATPAETRLLSALGAAPPVTSQGTMRRGATRRTAQPSPAPVAPTPEATMQASVSSGVPEPEAPPFDPSWTAAPPSQAAGAGGRGQEPPRTGAPTTATELPEPAPGGGAPSGGGPIRGPRGGTIFSSRETGQMYERQSRTGLDVQRLKEINENLAKFGKNLLPLIDSTEELTSKQKASLRVLDKYGKDIWKIAEGKELGSSEVERAIGEQLRGPVGRPDVTSALGAISGRLDADVLAAGAGMGGGPGDAPPSLRDRLGGGVKAITSGWGLMQMRRWWGMTGGKAQEWMGAAAQADMSLYGAAMQAGAPVSAPGGVAGSMMSSQIRAQAGRVELGRQVATAWQPGGELPMWEKGPLGAAMAIGMPAAGAGLIGGYLGGALGIAGLGPVGVGGAILAGTTNYMYQAGTDKVGRGVGLAGWQGLTRGEGWRGTSFPQFMGGLAHSFSAARSGITPGGPTFTDVARSTLEERAVGERILTGQTAGMGAEYMTEAMKIRGERMRKEYDIMSPEEYSTMEAQMMRYGGYENLGDIPEELEAKSAAFTRALGMAPGALQQRLGDVGAGWGLQKGTGGMEAFQASMLNMPTTAALERQLTVYQQHRPMQWFMGEAGMDALSINRRPTTADPRRAMDLTATEWGAQEIGGAEPVTPAQERRRAMLGGGDRGMWSRFGRQVGDQRFITQEEGGLPLFTSNIEGFSMQDLGLQTQAAQGGMWGVQDAMTATQRRYRDAGMARQGAQLGWRAEMTWGGGAGGAPTAPTAGSMWGIQDQSWALQGQAQMGDFAYQQNMFNVQNRQWQEAQGLSREIFESRTGWQQQAQAQQQQRADTTFGWQMEDWSYGESMSQLRYGWQMEDYDERIRMSTGRQRQTLQKGQERTTITESARREQHDKEKDRMEEKKGWSDEDFDKAKLRNEELTNLQRQRFDMSKRHNEETKGLQQGNMNRVRGNYMERRKLEEQQRNLQRLSAAKQHEWSLASLRDQRGLNKEYDLLVDDQRQLSREQQKQIAQWQTLLPYLDQMFTAYHDHIDDLLKLIDRAPQTRPQEPLPEWAPPGEKQPMGQSQPAPTVNVYVNQESETHGVVDAVFSGLTEYDQAYAQ